MARFARAARVRCISSRMLPLLHACAHSILHYPSVAIPVPRIFARTATYALYRSCRPSTLLLLCYLRVAAVQCPLRILILVDIYARAYRSRCYFRALCLYARTWLRAHIPLPAHCTALWIRYVVFHPPTFIAHAGAHRTFSHHYTSFRRIFHCGINI